MSQTLFILLITISAIAGWKIYNLKKELAMMKREAEEEKKIFSSLNQYNEKQTEIKNQNKARVMELFAKQEKVTNSNVAKYLGISSATAFRYLEELEQEGKIRQNKRLGKFVYYNKI
jgi:predicted HTH transcriptional regulator